MLSFLHFKDSMEIEYNKCSFWENNDIVILNFERIKETSDFSISFIFLYGYMSDIKLEGFFCNNKKSVNKILSRATPIHSIKTIKGYYMMIEIIGKREIIRLDITEFITDNKWLQSGDYIKCNIYFEKFECKFTSKDVLISYDALKNFNVNLKQLLNNGKECCLLTDQNSVISLIKI